MLKKGIIFILVCLLTACGVTPAPLSVDESYNQAQEDVKALFSPQKDFPRKLDYYEVLARSLKYNLDYRIKLANTALQAGQLDVAKFTMFPALNASGSLYTRDNDLSSYGITPQGQPTGVLNATPRTLRSARVALTWNILDFGLGYVRARQQGERILIAREEAHKQEQTLAKDVLIAYWDAYNSQELISETKEFQSLLLKTRNKITQAEHDKLIPQENILNFQAALLEGDRRLVQLQYKYDKAMIDLRHLMNVSPDQPIVLAPPPNGVSRIQNLSKVNFEKLDTVTLVKRPELRGQEYQRRIAELGIKIAILQSLPGITFNEGWNYNSNKFLINQKWVDRSMDLAWNLLNLASLPTNYNAASVQVKYELLKRMALTIGVLTETRYAYWHYKTLTDEYLIAKKQTENAEAIYKLNYNRKEASLASDQQVIIAKLHVITSKMEAQLLLSDLSTALGELYLSCGSDILPIDVENQSVSELTELIRRNFAMEKIQDFNEYVNLNYKEIVTDPAYVASQHKKTVQTTKALQLAQVDETAKAIRATKAEQALSMAKAAQIARAERLAKAEAESKAEHAAKAEQLTRAEQAFKAAKAAQIAKIDQAEKVQQLAKIEQAAKEEKAAEAVRAEKAEQALNAAKAIQVARLERLAKADQLVKNEHLAKITQVALQTKTESILKISNTKSINKPIQEVKAGLSSKPDLLVTPIVLTQRSTKPSDASYTIQLFGSFSLENVKNYKNELHLAQQLTYHQTQNKGRDWYVLTLGQFNTVKEAKLTMKQLPKSVQDQSAWIRSTSELHYIG